MDCIDDLVDWCLKNDMQVNPDKTELLLVDSALRLKDIDNTDKIQIASTLVSFSNAVKILCVTIDSSLSFDRHVFYVVQSCNYHIHALRHITPLLSYHLACQIACSIVASRLDHYNSILCNTSVINILSCIGCKTIWHLLYAGLVLEPTQYPYFKNCGGSLLNTALNTKLLLLLSTFS